VSNKSRLSHQESLQNILRNLRLKAGLKQSELAKRLGRPQSFVSKYESGERSLDLIEIQQICQIVEIPLQELIRQFERAMREA
jgi:transcriptional regulator with XRE-family HTH domain